MYSASMAARLVGLTSTRVRRWLQGYEYSYISGSNKKLCTGHKGPIVDHAVDAASGYASFLDLIDLLFVKQFIDKGVSLQRTRKALEEAKSIIGSGHFAQQTFFTNGHEIYLRVKENGDAILELLSHGQWTIAPIIQELSYKIDFDHSSGLARRWFPLGKESHVVLDPDISFGRPSIFRQGIATANIYDFFLAEKEKIHSVCTWFNLNQDEVKDAIKFEKYLMAA